jgi:hypothetical protein
MGTLQGFDSMVRKLDTLKDRSAKKVAKAGVNAGLGKLSQEMRRAVNAAPITAEMKKAARATIAKRLNKKEGEPWKGKAGFGVGKRTKAKKDKAAARSDAGAMGATRGVGISAANIHWGVLGTVERKSAPHPAPLPAAMINPNLKGKARESAKAEVASAGSIIRTVSATGRMSAVLKGVVQQAVAGAGPAMLEAARKKVTQVLAAEASKLRKGS